MARISRRNWLRTSLLVTTASLLPAQHVFGNEHTTETPFGKELLLHWNENPLGPSPKAVEAVTKVLGTSNRYADAYVNTLKEKLAAKHGLSAKEFFISAGSTEVLSLLGQHVGLSQGQILSPWPSFPTLLYFGARCGAEIKKVGLDGTLQMDLEKVLDAIDPHTQLIFICNPNNPTGRELDNETFKGFCKRVPSHILVCVDEAYIEYSSMGEGGSMVSLINELPNLVISRTFSKAFGLAGLRIGYAISQVQNIRELQKRHLGGEISAGLAPLVAAIESLDDQVHLERVLSENEKGRNMLYEAFDQWGASYCSSSTNFLYVESKRFDPSVKDKLEKDEILIAKWPDMMKDHVRITIGKQEEMQRFLQVIETHLI